MTVSWLGTSRRLGAAAIILLATGSHADETIDLIQAVNYALSQNKRLARSALDVKANAFRVTEAQADFLVSVRPELSLGAAEGKETSAYGLRASKKLPWGTEAAVSGRMSAGQDDAGSDLRRGSVLVEIQQPLFRNFGPLVQTEGVTQAGSDLKTARRRYETRKADLVVEVADAYESLIRLGRQVESAKDSVKRFTRLHRLTKAKEALGRTTRVDTLRVELQLGQARVRLETHQERLASARRDFADLLSFPADTLFHLAPTVQIEIGAANADEAVRTALASRLDYAQALSDSDDAERGARIASRRLWPDLKLAGRYEQYGEGTSRADASRLDRGAWFVGFSVDTDFNLAKDRAVSERARIVEASARRAVEIVELSIAREVQSALLAWRRAQAEAKIAERNFGLARARARLAQRLFEIGRGDNFTVTDAEESYLQAEDQMLQARAEATVSTYRLFRAMGTLLEPPADLKPLVLSQKSQKRIEEIER